MTDEASSPHSLTGATRRVRYEHGKALRKKTPRERFSDCQIDARDPVAILAESDASRIQTLLPVRYSRMIASPFAFLRGAAAVMASDFIDAPEVGALVQACGDAHCMNFGVFATPENNIVFDINDFDETLPGVDFTVDLRRLAASVAVAALTIGVSDKQARATARDAARAYRETMAQLAMASPLANHYSRVDIALEAVKIREPKLAAQLRKILSSSKATVANDDNFPHLAISKKSGAIIADKPPLIYHKQDGDAVCQAFDPESAFAAYSQTLPPDRAMLFARYRLKDFAIKVVGVGSVGTFCGVGLFMSSDDEPLFLQIKEAQTSVLERLAPQSAWKGPQGQRVVSGQVTLQAASDIFLGWTASSDVSKQFYVRQLKNRRLGSLAALLEGSALPEYAGLCGRTLAHGHARSGDPAVIAGYLGKTEKMDDSIASFAMLYAAQTKKDHAALVAAKPGLVAAS